MPDTATITYVAGFALGSFIYRKIRQRKQLQKKTVDNIAMYTHQ